MLGRAVRKDDVLDFQLDELVVVLEQVAVDILVVAEAAKLIDGDVEFARANRRDRRPVP